MCRVFYAKNSGHLMPWYHFSEWLVYGSEPAGKDNVL